MSTMDMPERPDGNVLTDDEAAAEDTSPLKIIAYRRMDGLLMGLKPAPRWRKWMKETQDGFANRCLPLLVANQSGWVLLNPATFQATWDGGQWRSNVTVEFADKDIGRRKPVASHFGHGIITWEVPYLFRTPPGFNLLARGPANMPKDGASALDGLIETDWAVASFTMNWKLTRANHPVTFEADEPFCMVVPQRRGELERFQPEIRAMESDPQTHEEFEQWSQSRDKATARKFFYSHLVRDSDAARKLWQRHYFKGISPGESRSAAHQTTRKLSGFERHDS
jgi:hypothetical protein